MHARKAVTLLACLALVSCAGPFSDVEAETRKQLLELAPIGSDAKAALPMLADRGFHCKWTSQAEFQGLKGKNDYLYCDLEESYWLIFMRRWQLALVHDRYIVTDAQVGFGLTGP
jgi:hypothetical protein